MSQIKFFIVRLLQNYVIDKAKTTPTESQNDNYDNRKCSKLIETQDILFNAPIGGVYVSIDRKKLINNLNKD